MLLPESFVERMRAELGAEQAEQLCHALMTEPSTSVRLNPRKAFSPEWASERIAWSEHGYTLAERPSFTLDAAFHAGAYYVQEASSQFAGYIMASALGGKERCEGKRVLDMCAAPGGKSTHYASLVGEQGLVVANEINRQRAAVLADNARKWGMGNMVVTCNDSSRVAQVRGWFDVVAVDAPCSGEGMFRKSDEAVEQWSEANVAMCADRQWEILENAFQALRPGGVLIYSTCTFNRTEDEDVVRRLSEAYADELQAAPEIMTYEQWGVTVGREGVFQTFRFFPHKVAGEGMFMAVAMKRDDAPSSAAPKSRSRSVVKVERRVEEELRRWVLQPDEMRFFQAGEMLYGCYKSHFEDIEMLSGLLSVIYSGVAMGQIFKGRLKPDAALALFADMRRDAVACSEVEESVALQFLRKQEVDASLFEEGVNLVVRGGLSLGFVKRIGNRVNNMYPNALRILK